MLEIKKSVCVWCKGECGVLVHVEDGRLVKVEEDPGYARKVWPPTKGCPRHQATKEWFYHPDKVNFPLKRVGDKGEGKWQRIPWEQALDEIAEKLKQIKEQYGSEGISYSGGTGYRTEYSPTVVRFFNALGTLNIAGQGVICLFPRLKMGEAIAGWFPHYSVTPKTKCIVMLGAEPLMARPITAKNILAARDQGAKLIVIDPRRTRSASMADVWLQLRPGTDYALLLGMINVIIKEELYDKEFVEKWCYGFDKARERAEEYPPEKVELITQVPADKIREAARVYALNRPGCFIEGMGVEQSQNNAATLQARWILAGLTANINVEGGEEQNGPHPTQRNRWQVEPRAIPPREQFTKMLGADRFKLFTMGWMMEMLPIAEKVWGVPQTNVIFAHAPTVFRAMITGKPYPVRAMVTVASNPMVTFANTKLVYKALKSLDLYVVLDHWMTPSAELADYVLSPACWLQRPILWDFGSAPHMIAGEAALPKVMPGEYEHKDEYEIFKGLASRMGLEKYFPWKDLEGYYDYLLQPAGYTHKEYVNKVRCELKPLRHKNYEKVGFATPTGKVEFYSTIVEKFGHDPLPPYQEPAETPLSAPELAKEYPLMLITGGRTRGFYHSEWRQIESVRKQHPHPLLQIHPDTAGKLGISDGDWVWVEGVRGRVKQKAQLFDGILPNVVHAEHGWWLPELPGEEPWLHGVWEVNINVLLNDDPEVCNPVTGSWPLKTALCKVYKVKEYPPCHDKYTP